MQLQLFKSLGKCYQTLARIRPVVLKINNTAPTYGMSADHLTTDFSYLQSLLMGSRTVYRINLTQVLGIQQ